MADADEDVILTQSSRASSSSSTSASPHGGHLSHTNDDSESDDDAAAVDYRFLTTGSKGKGSGGKGGSLPRRGEKDFEPNTLKSQTSALEASREAMRDALSVQRFHIASVPGVNNNNAGLVGQFYPDEADWDGGRLRGQVGGKIREGEGRCVLVEKFTGIHGKTMGQTDRKNRTWLLPEEALFLLERGSLDVRWPDLEDSDDAEEKQDVGPGVEAQNPKSTSDTERSKEDRSREAGDDDERKNVERLRVEDEEEERWKVQLGELPMSLQGAYSSFIGRSGLTLERYIVYAGLKRLGYIVQRAASWDGSTPYSTKTSFQSQSQSDSRSNGQAVVSSAKQQSSPAHVPSNFVYRLLSWMFDKTPNPYTISNPSTTTKLQRRAHGPLVAPGIYRNYNDMFRALTLIPYHTSIPATSTLSVRQDEDKNSTTNTVDTDVLPQPRPQSQPQPQPRSRSSFNQQQQPFTVAFDVWKPSATSTSSTSTAPPPSGAWRKSSPPTPDFRICVVDARASSPPNLAQIGELLDAMPSDEQPAPKKTENRIKHGKKNVIIAVVDSGVVSYLRFSESMFGDYKLYEEKRNGGGGKRGRGGGRGGERGGERGGRGGGAGGWRNKKTDGQG